MTQLAEGLQQAKCAPLVMFAHTNDPKLAEVNLLLGHPCTVSRRVGTDPYGGFAGDLARVSELSVMLCAARTGLHECVCIIACLSSMLRLGRVSSLHV